MTSGSQYRLVFVTAPSIKTARSLARRCLEARLAACVNLLPRLESHYWWKSKRETSAEVLLLIKTRARLLTKLERLVLRHHPYETPEFIALKVEGGSAGYLEWLDRETVSSPRRSRGETPD